MVVIDGYHKQAQQIHACTYNISKSAFSLIVRLTIPIAMPKRPLTTNLGNDSCAFLRK